MEGGGQEGPEGKNTGPSTCRGPGTPAPVDPPVPETEQAPTESELERRVEEAEKLGEMGRSPVITDLTVGPDGCGGQVIYVGWGGTSQEKVPTNHGKQGPREGIPEVWNGEEALKVLTGDSGSL